MVVSRSRKSVECLFILGLMFYVVLAGHGNHCDGDTGSLLHVGHCSGPACVLACHVHACSTHMSYMTRLRDKELK